MRTILIIILAFFVYDIARAGDVTSYDFETGTEGFRVHSTGDLHAECYTTDNYAYSGDRSLVIEVINNGYGNLQLVANKIDINPGDQIRVSFYLRCNQERHVIIKSQYGLSGGGARVFFEKTNVMIGQTWNKIEVNITVPDEINGQIPEDVFVGFTELNIGNLQGLKYYVDLYKIEFFKDIPVNMNEVFYVSENGKDTTGNGGIGQPLRTIKAALSHSKKGDTIILMGGIYQESNEILSDNICIIGQHGTEPVISGLDTIKNWTLHDGNVYKANVSLKVSQLFTKENGELKQMVYARYPNLSSNDLFNQNYAIANSVDYNSLAPSTLYDVDLSQLNGIDVVGASLWLPYPFDTRWNSNTETITSQTSSTLGFTASMNDDNLRENKNYNVWYHLTGKLSLLDAETEWYFDHSEGVLYFYAPGGLNPNELTILARTRDISLVINNSNGICIKGITFLATGLIGNGNNLTVHDCRFYYPTPFFNTERWNERAVFSLKGDGNLIEKCEVAYSWGTGISMRNSTNGTIRNCLVHDCNWSGSISPGIWISGTSMTASQNTIYNMGRSGIRLYHAYRSIFEFNHIYNYGLINTDLGSIKGGLQDYEHSVWRYNLSHDFNDSPDAAKAGIYLDASNDNATVHHNVHYGVHLSINGNVNNNSILNNTFVRPSDKKVWSHYIRPGTDWNYRSVYTYNNLATNTVKGTSLQNNLIENIDSFKFAGAEYGDFRLLGNSPAIDQALYVAGINDNYTGSSPDIGAYEYGDTTINGTWMAGITWSPDWNSLPSAQINVTKDSLYPSRYFFSVKDDIDADGWIMRYDWDFGDGKKAYGKTVSHIYKQNGEYEVTLTLRDNLAGISTIRESLNIYTVLNITYEPHQFISYNNPASEKIFIRNSGSMSEFRLINATGSILITGKLYSGLNHIDISHIPEGLYLLNIYSANRNMSERVIIIR